MAKAIEKATSAGDVLAHRGEDLRDDLAHVAGQQLVGVRAEEQHDQEDAADDRHREQELERRIGDELHGDERPVGRGDQRAALQRRFESGGNSRPRLSLPLRYSA